MLATNFTAEGEATAHVLDQALRSRGVRVTRLARGVPIGSELEYVDLGTIAHAYVDRPERRRSVVSVGARASASLSVPNAPTTGPAGFAFDFAAALRVLGAGDLAARVLVVCTDRDGAVTASPRAR